ncbi:hypothetical protein HYV70_00135 [Candidatus Uhrbacteria bacterium]|nr:hypothetical protein [Candidatus Uhrbacteria bacterium]
MDIVTATQESSAQLLWNREESVRKKTSTHILPDSVRFIERISKNN